MSKVDTLSFSNASVGCKGTLGTVLGQFGDVHDPKNFSKAHTHLSHSSKKFHFHFSQTQQR